MATLDRLLDQFLQHGALSLRFKPNHPALIYVDTLWYPVTEQPVSVSEFTRMVSQVSAILDWNKAV